MTENNTHKEAYREWAKTQPSLPVFMQPWWMDAVCAGKQWDVILIRRNDTILAALPYLIRHRLWQRFIVMPQQTQIGGLWVNEHLELSERIADEIICSLCQQLDHLHLAYYSQHWPLHSTLARKMEAYGYRVRERVTYRIEEMLEKDEFVKHFSKNKRRQLQKAEHLGLIIEEDRMSVEEFYRFHQQCLARRRKTISYSREFLLVLARKTRRQEQSKIISISDDAGNVLAAAFLVWDQHSLYYLIPCYAPEYKDSGAGTLLVVGAVELARKLGKQFDFEGSMIHSVAHHYRQFGSSPALYCAVDRIYKPIFRLILLLNKLRERKL